MIARTTSNFAALAANSPSPRENGRERTHSVLLGQPGPTAKKWPAGDEAGRAKNYDADGAEASGRDSVVNFSGKESAHGRPCRSHTGNLFESSRRSADRKQRAQIEGNLAGMNVACGGVAAVCDTENRRSKPAVASPRLLEINLTYPHNVSASRAWMTQRALVKVREFRACFGEWMAVLGRGEGGSQRLHWHHVAVIREGIDIGDARKLIKRLARKHGIGLSLVVPVRSVERYSAYMADNAESVRATVPPGTHVVAVSKSANRWHAKFNWAASKDFRVFVGNLALAVGIEDVTGLEAALGKKWSGRLTYQFRLARKGRTFAEVFQWYKDTTNPTPPSLQNRQRTTKAPAAVAVSAVVPAAEAEFRKSSADVSLVAIACECSVAEERRRGDGGNRMDFAGKFQ
jgi:hypothetical protein